jgi:phospholipase C
LPSILFSDKFRCFEEMESDLRNTPPDQLPQVIFVEPTYQDAPHTGTSTDDHAPAGISDGQEFLMLVYKAVTASQAFWESALMIVDYDEHGGFFDHVPPPIIPTNPPAGAKWSVPFKSLGVRIPAFIISPFVGAGGVSHNLLDHTSVLKLLGEKFGNGSYSSEVDSRPVGSVSHVLDFINPILQAPAPPPLDDYLKLRPPAPAGVIIPPQNTALQIGFSNVIASMKQHGADASHPKFGQLLG